MKKKGMILGMMGLMGSLLLLGCGGKGDSSGQRPSRQGVLKDRGSEDPRELELPAVPDSITEPGERAAYAVAHFWDALDPKDHAQSLDTAFMEQSFANFIGLLHYASDEARKRAVKAFADKCGEDEAVYDLGAHIARHYLDDPNSPMRSEELYIPFLMRFCVDRKLSEVKRERAAYRLQQALKNRPGRRATDFRLVTRDGRTSTLLRELKDTTLVLFYDHDCGHCKETVERLASPRARLRYPVIAVEVTEDREGWEGTKHYLPAGWTVAFATDPIDGEAYYFPALPSGYLLAGDGEVLVKDGVF